MRFYSNQYLNFALCQYEALGRESQALAVKPQAYEVVTRVRHSTAVRRLASARETNEVKATTLLTPLLLTSRYSHSCSRLLALHYNRHFSVMRQSNSGTASLNLVCSCSYLHHQLNIQQNRQKIQNRVISTTLICQQIKINTPGYARTVV